MTSDELIQRQTCKKWGAAYVPADPQLKLGIARNVQEGLYPINGLRHSVSGDNCGWYIWGGEELSDADEFFLPLHVDHLNERCPSVKMYLGLAPGWRFLIAPGHEDVWFDGSLLSQVE